MPTNNASPSRPAEDEALRLRLKELCAEGWEIWEKFSEGDIDRPFHPFQPADYDKICEEFLPYRGNGLRFMEWGSATGVLTVMADMLGFEAYGIEIDADLVDTARELATKFDSKAKFAAASLIPEGYQWQGRDGDNRTGTIGNGPSGYLELGHSLDEFDVVFGFPWDGENTLMFDVMKQYGRVDALLLINSLAHGIKAYRGGKEITGERWFPKSSA